MKKSSLLLMLIALTACSAKSSTGPDNSSSSGSSSGSQGPTPLSPPALGMQLVTTPVTLATAAEQYTCWSFKVPDNGAISVVGLDNQVPTQGIHHWAVFTNTDPVTNPGPYECATMGISWGLVSGGGLGTPGVHFPDNVAMKLPAGQHIIFQLHMLNATGAELNVPPAYINLLGTNATDYQPVGLLIAGTLNITVPAHGTDVAVTGGCKLDKPLEHIFSVFPHMHQLGKRISAVVQPSAQGAAVQTLADQTWGFADQKLYPAQGSAAAGDSVSVTCRYDNPGETPVYFGLSTHDEMCINVLYYYPAMDPAKPSTYCGLQ
jgi:Copper type II ascorbate-dependent monooxygenase, C-terminal domain